MTDILTVLDNTALLEENLAKFYEWLGEKFSHNKELRAFYHQMSFDELAHRDLVKYQIRVVRKEKDQFSDVDISLDYLKDISEKVMEHRKNDLPSVEDSLRQTVEIENSLAERYFETVIKQSNKGFAALIQNLGDSSKEHLERCLEMAKKHNIPTDQD